MGISKENIKFIIITWDYWKHGFWDDMSKSFNWLNNGWSCNYILYGFLRILLLILVISFIILFLLFISIILILFIIIDFYIYYYIYFHIYYDHFLRILW